MPFVVSRSAELTTKPVERSTELVAGRERPLAAERSPFDKLRANEGTSVTVIAARST